MGQNPKRSLKDDEGEAKMLHALDSQSFLKVDGLNSIVFEMQDDNNRVINITHEYVKGGNVVEDQNYIESIYKLKVHEPTLRELLIFDSLYVCKN